MVICFPGRDMQHLLLELLPELLEHIYRYCHITDLVNVACCSQEYYNSIQFLIWKSVDVPWTVNKNEISQTAKCYLKYTRDLKFSYRNVYTKIPPEERWKIVTNSFDTILKYCDCVTSLKVETIFSDQGLQLISGLLRNLRELSLSRCHCITKRGWSLVKAFPHLKKLELLDCDIEDDNFKEIVEQLDLTALKINQCVRLSSVCLEHISSFASKSLKVCSISCWRFKDAQHIQELSKMKCLKQLIITGYHNATNNAIITLNSLPLLDMLDLSCCSNLNDFGLSKLTLLPYLRMLSICDCGLVTDTGLHALVVLKSLTKLNVSGCWKLTDAGMPYLASLQSLMELNIGGCRFITDIGISDLVTITTLRKLNISGCRYVTDIGLAEISNLYQLCRLCIGGCNISDLGISQLLALTRLETLNLSECSNITDFGLAQLSKLNTLKKLNFHGCTRITYIGLVQLTKLKLEEVNLKDCHLSVDAIEQFCIDSGLKELLSFDGENSRLLTRDHHFWRKQKNRFHEC